jgi:hypothetical protein
MAAMEPPDYIFPSEDLISALGLLKEKEKELPPPPPPPIIPLIRHGVNRSISCSSDEEGMEFRTMMHLKRFKRYLDRAISTEKDSVKLESHKQKLDATNSLLNMLS